MKNLYPKTVFSTFHFPRSSSFKKQLSKGIFALALVLSVSLLKAQTSHLSEYFRANLYLENASHNMIMADGIMAEFNTQYSDSIKIEDGLKFININENIGILRHGVTLSVERRPFIVETDTLFLRLWKTTQRNYQVEFLPVRLDHPGLQAFLQDTYLNTSSPISLTNPTKVNFSVTAAAGSGATDRFRIVFNIAAPVPVTLTNITATLVNENVDVQWKVENEVSMLKYEVEKSMDGTNFSPVNTTAVSGVNNLSNTYNWLDINATAGANFYRIKMYDMAGRFRYSNIVKVDIESKFTSIVVYPNPVKNNVIGIQMGNQPGGTYYFRLVNAAGQTVYKTNGQYVAPNAAVTLKSAGKLSQGLYYLEIASRTKMVAVKKVIVE